MNGLFTDPGPRGRGSAEAQALAKLPLDRTEIKRELHHDSCGVVVLTEDGHIICLPWMEARKLGLTLKGR